MGQYEALPLELSLGDWKYFSGDKDFPKAIVLMVFFQILQIRLIIKSFIKFSSIGLSLVTLTSVAILLNNMRHIAATSRQCVSI